MQSGVRFGGIRVAGSNPARVTISGRSHVVTTQTESLAAAAVKLSPPASVIAVSVAGMSLQDWVWAATLLYTVMLIVHHVWSKWLQPWIARRSLAAKMGLPPE